MNSILGYGVSQAQWHLAAAGRAERRRRRDRLVDMNMAFWGGDKLAEVVKALGED